MSLVPFIADLKQSVLETDHLFSENYVPDRHTEPIPFFGDPSQARVLTIGVNPSAAEFIGDRWPTAELTPEDLTDRLCSYFVRQHPPAHPWFESWTEALTLLDCDYRQNAAHLDLSSRATKSVWKKRL